MTANERTREGIACRMTFHAEQRVPERIIEEKMISVTENRLVCTWQLTS